MLRQSSDEIQMMVNESRSVEITKKSRAALVYLRKYKFEGFHLHFCFLLTLQNVGVASSTDEALEWG